MKKNMNKIQDLLHFGPVKCDIDNELKEVRLSVNRKRDPLSQSSIERVILWAFSRARDKFPDYKIVIDGEVKI